MWSQADLDLLKDMWLRGFSSGIIAAAIGKSRGAVMGKVFRLNLKREKKKPTHTTQSKDEKDWYRICETSGELYFPGAYSLLGLKTRQCRWPVAYSNQHLFCGAARIGASAYCADHTKQAWRTNGGQ